MRFSQHRAVVVALTLTAAVALTGCDDEPKDDAKSSDPASASASSPASSASASSTAVPETVEGAIGRYEDYLHAVGASELDTMCEIAEPAMAAVSGDCESNFRIMLGMFSPEQLEALTTATIDASQVTRHSGGAVDIPASAVRSDADFGPNDLGDVTMEYRDDNWFIVD